MFVQELWPFTPALRRAAALGVPFKQEGFGAVGVGRRGQVGQFFHFFLRFVRRDVSETLIVFSKYISS